MILKSNKKNCVINKLASYFPFDGLSVIILTKIKTTDCFMCLFQDMLISTVKLLT